jgi:hypothetical protein
MVEIIEINRNFDFDFDRRNRNSGKQSKFKFWPISLKYKFFAVLGSRIIFMWLRLLLYCKARQNYQKELNFKYMLKLLYFVHMILYDLLYVAENMNWMGYKLLHFVLFFNS